MEYVVFLARLPRPVGDVFGIAGSLSVALRYNSPPPFLTEPVPETLTRSYSLPFQARVG